MILDVHTVGFSGVFLLVLKLKNCETEIQVDPEQSQVVGKKIRMFFLFVFPKFPAWEKRSHT